MKLTLSFPFSLYGDQCLSRAAKALPELQRAYLNYRKVVDHPRAVHWEKKVVTQKLINDRREIFRSYHTSNAKISIPFIVSGFFALYCLGIPAQQLGEFFTDAAGMDVISPLAVAAVGTDTSKALDVSCWFSAGGVAIGSLASLCEATSGARAPSMGGLVSGLAASSCAGAAAAGSAGMTSSILLVSFDPTLTLAIALSLYNINSHLRQRTGFNDTMDMYIVKARSWLRLLFGYVLTPVSAASSTVVLTGNLAAGTCAPLQLFTAGAGVGASVLPFFPGYLGPVWLGIASVSLLKHALLHNTAPGRALARIEEYPAIHGHYGNLQTAAASEARLAFVGDDLEERRDNWEKQKKVLEYECDVRLQKFLRRIGIFNDMEELEYEREKLIRKRQIASERRRAAREAKLKQQNTHTSSEATEQGQQEASSTGASSSSPNKNPDFPKRTEDDPDETFRSLLFMDANASPEDLAEKLEVYQEQEQQKKRQRHRPE